MAHIIIETDAEELNFHLDSFGSQWLIKLRSVERLNRKHAVLFFRLPLYRENTTFKGGATVGSKLRVTGALATP